MTDVKDAARKLLAAAPGEGVSSKDIAERAGHICERLTQHLARLLGHNGVAILIERSIALASVEFPWLAPRIRIDDSACSALREAMVHQDPKVATEAFSSVLSLFVALLKRLIGDGLVDRLLSEVWPAVFPQAAKESP